MKRNHLLAALAVIALVIASSALAADVEAPAVQIEEKQVIASGVPAGSRVAFFSVGLGSDGYTSSVRRIAQVLPDDDRDGRVLLDVPGGVAWRSVWVVVDVGSGRYTIATPEGYATKIENRGKRFGRSRGVDVDQLINAGGYADVLYIHPDGGVWLVRAEDGGAHDLDGGENGMTSVSLGDFQSLGTAAERPDGFTPGGVLITIDLSEMRTWVVRLTGPMLEKNAILAREEGH